MIMIPNQLLHRLWVASGHGAGWRMGTLWLAGVTDGGVALTDGVIPVVLVMGVALLWWLGWPGLARWRPGNRTVAMTVQDSLQETAERLNLALSAAQMGAWDWHLEQGRVWLVSALGEGSRFYFTWPLVGA